MGRPIKKAYLGNTAAASQAIAINAWVAGDTQARTGWIVKQKTFNGYSCNTANVVAGTTFIGTCFLQNGAPTAAGQASLLITPYGANGSGVNGTANVSLYSPGTLSVLGTGLYSASYKPGEFLTLVGGTSSVVANLSIQSVQVRIAPVASSGNGYTVGDTFTFSGPNFASAATVAVATTTGNGQVATVNVTTGGSYTSSTLPVGAQTANVAVTSNTSVGTAPTFNLGWAPNQLSVINAGVYSSVPTNPVATTGSASGTGATINVSWSVSSVYVNNGGSGYDGPGAVNVSFNSTSQVGSPALATATVSATTGNVTAVTVQAGGSYSTVPGVIFANSATTKYAYKLEDRTVTAFDGSSYQWLATGSTMTNNKQAIIPTA